MAEVVAGAVVAEQVAATGIEAGGAALAVAQPTLPLRATFHQIATAQEQDESLELARSHHTTTVLGSKAYMFGGRRSDGKLCSNMLHGIALPLADEQPGNSEYVCYPAVSATDAVPSSRSDHSACVREDSLIIHGGRGEDGNSLDESCLWSWNSKTLQWGKLSFVGEMPSPRYGHTMLFDKDQDNLILHGGFGAGGPLVETWRFGFASYAWTKLPPPPAASLAAQLANRTLYAISGDSDVNGSIHSLSLEPQAAENQDWKWSTVDFPTSPLIPGPRPRISGALVFASTGLGRHYLVSLFGSRHDVAMASSDKTFTEKTPLYSDFWALQVPSEYLSASQAKDTVRDYLPGFESGTFTWGEVETVPVDAKDAASHGHPGPRAYFGADILPDGTSVIIWGGLNDREETKADGWLVKLG